MKTYVVPYASRVENKLPCRDTRARCKKAMKIAEKHHGIIVLGTGFSKKYNEVSFAEVLERYMIKHGWPKERILINPQGFGSIAETEAAYQAIKKDGDGNIVAVTAWYHIPRVWLIWAIHCKRFVRVGISWKTYPWTNPIRELLVFPRTLFNILKSAF